MPIAELEGEKKKERKDGDGQTTRIQNWHICIRLPLLPLVSSVTLLLAYKTICERVCVCGGGGGGGRGGGGRLWIYC